MIIDGIAALTAALFNKGLIMTNEAEVIEPYAKQHPNITYKRLDKDPGLYPAWNICIQNTYGADNDCIPQYQNKLFYQLQIYQRK